LPVQTKSTVAVFAAGIACDYSRSVPAGRRAPLARHARKGPERNCRCRARCCLRARP